MRVYTYDMTMNESAIKEAVAGNWMITNTATGRSGMAIEWAWDAHRETLAIIIDDSGVRRVVDSLDAELLGSSEVRSLLAAPLGSPDNPCDCGNGELLMPCKHWRAIGREC